MNRNYENLSVRSLSVITGNTLSRQSGIGSSSVCLSQTPQFGEIINEQIRFFLKKTFGRKINLQEKIIVLVNCMLNIVVILIFSQSLLSH